MERVKLRVSEGGHNIPEDVIERRYLRGIKNLNEIFIDLVDYWIVIDNSKRPFSFVAVGGKGIDQRIFKSHNVE